MKKLTFPNLYSDFLRYDKLSPAILAALLTIISSALICWLYPSLNADATLYLLAADTFKMEGPVASKAVYPHPYYPIFIGWLSEQTGLSSLLSARLINFSLMALLAYAFVHCVSALGGNRSAQWSAAAVILLLPNLADYRNYLIRDFGYWGFFLTGFTLLLHYQKKGQILFALGWLISCSIAGLFRKEAFLFIPIIPLFLLSPKQGLLRGLKLLAPLYLIPLTILAAFFALDVPILEYIDDLLSGTDRRFHRLVNSLAKINNIMETKVLTYHSREHAPLGLFLTLSAIFLVTLASAISTPLALTSGYYALRRQWRAPTNGLYWGVVIVTIGILIAFLLYQRFLQARYMLLLAILLLIPLCIALGNDLKHATKKKRHIFAAIGTIILLDNHISTGDSNSHIEESLHWLQPYQQQDLWIYTNAHELAYKSKLRVYWPHTRQAKRKATKTNPKILAGYDLIAIEAGRKDKDIHKFISKLDKRWPRAAHFSNPKGDQVVIYISKNARKIRRQAYWKEIQPLTFVNPN